MAGVASDEEHSSSGISSSSLSNGGGGSHAVIQKQEEPQRREADKEERRRQNRDAAARHRRRQQDRLQELTHKEAVLKQRVAELELGIESLKRSRAGLALPQRDHFTTTVLGMLDDVEVLRKSLIESCDYTRELISG
ncbi:hypothetical protein IWW50_004696, partial [Coemansia erecta]